MRKKVLVRKSNQYQFENRTSKNFLSVEGQDSQAVPNKGLNKGNKIDTLLDTDYSQDLMDKSLHDSNIQQKETNQLLKDGLKKYIPESIHHTLSNFSNDYQQMYDWVGIILRCIWQVKNVCNGI